MRFDFNSCPDCGNDYDYPHFYRDVYYDYSRNVSLSAVKAVCATCKWETDWHNNVKECADEWNNTVLYELASEDEIYENASDDVKKLVDDLGLYTKTEVCSWCITNDAWKAKE